jgi:hypothetical protein
MTEETEAKEEKKKKVEPTKVMACSCFNPFQDERYGKNKRLHNTAYSKSSIRGWACTVCSNLKLNK